MQIRRTKYKRKFTERLQLSVFFFLNSIEHMIGALTLCYYMVDLTSKMFNFDGSIRKREGNAKSN